MQLACAMPAWREWSEVNGPWAVFVVTCAARLCHACLTGVVKARKNISLLVSEALHLRFRIFEAATHFGFQAPHRHR